jgi:integrase
LTRTAPSARKSSSSVATSLKVENELADGNSTAPLVKNGKTFREVAELMQSAHAHTLKPKTRRDSAAAFRLYIYPTFGSRRISTITTMDIEQWLADRRAALSEKTGKPFSQSSIRTCYVGLSSVFKYAVQLRLISVDPCVPVRIPKVDHQELTFLTPGQVAAVVERLDATAPDGLIVLTAAYTGLRAGELEGLRVGDVNLFARQPYVRVQRQAQFTPGVGWEYITPKSRNSIRIVPLNRVLVERLREHLAQHPHAANPNAPFWPGRRRGGHGKTRGALDYTLQFNHGNMYQKHFLPVLAELGIPAVRWHDLRHFYASACAAAGIPDRASCEIHGACRHLHHVQALSAPVRRQQRRRYGPPGCRREPPGAQARRADRLEVGETLGVRCRFGFAAQFF